MANGICYIEIIGKDVAGKSKFFKDVFGWNATPHGDTYAMWSSGKEELEGGFSSHGESGTIAYIEVDDIEATLKTISENGGSTVVPKTKIDEDHGFFAHFNDCCGTTVGLWAKT